MQAPGRRGKAGALQTREPPPPGRAGRGWHVTLRDGAASRWRRTWRCGVGLPSAPSGSGARERMSFVMGKVVIWGT